MTSFRIGDRLAGRVKSTYFIAAIGVSVLIDTGAANFDDVDRALALLTVAGVPAVLDAQAWVEQ